MFVYLQRRGWYGAIAFASTLAIGACGPGNQTSTLRPDGPPEVLTVDLPGPDPRIALGEEAPGSIIEVATFCKTQGPNDGAMGAGDPKRPSTITPNDLNILQVCPNDDTKPQAELEAADPSTWYVRIEFDELLDPAVEDLEPITNPDGSSTGTSMGTLKNTQPVTLECQSSMGNGAMVPVPYDGYYDPSGNSESYPLGPSLVIQPNDPTLVATGSQCQITLKDNIKDKDGNPVPTDQRGPYTWGIGTITVTSIAPMDGTSVDPVAAGADLVFNTVVDGASVVMGSTYTPAVANLFPGAGAGPTEIIVGGDFPASAGPFDYKLASVADNCGKVTTFTPSEATNTETKFSTNPIMLTGITGADSPANGIVLAFNQFMDVSTFTQFTVTPAVTGLTPIDQGPNLLLIGQFKLGTAYTFTLAAGAAIKDCPGGEDQAGGTCVSSATFTNGAAQTVPFTTAAMIVLNNSSPMDNGTIGTTDSLTLSFNQNIDPTTFDAADYTITPAVTLAAQAADPFGDLAIGPGPIDAMTGAFAAWAPGDYTFTLKGTASLTDGITGDPAFSPGQDLVIHFTVMPAMTGGTPPSCL